MEYRKSILMFAILFLVSVGAKHCDIFGERITFGDYYTTKNPSNSVFIIAANTRDVCTNTQIKIMSPEGKILYKKNHFQTKHIDGSKYTNGLYDYSAYSYFFNITLSEYVKEGGSFLYQVGNSSVYEVTVPYAHQQDGKPDTFIVYGDYDANIRENLKGQDDMGQATHDYFSSQIQAESRDYDKKLFLGDMAYDIISDKYYRGERFFKKVAPYYGAIPEINTYGNHESGDKLEDYGYKYVNDYFYMPEYKTHQNENFKFISKYGQFIDFFGDPFWYKKGEDKKQKILEQLEAQLIEAQKYRDEKPWLFMFSHYPIYYTNEDNEFEPLRPEFQQVENLLNKYKVDFYMGAHVHAYQRYLPAVNGSKASWETIPGQENAYKNPTAPLYVVEGVAGQSHKNWHTPYKGRELLQAQDEGIAGVGKLKIYNKTHMQYTHFRTESQELIDDFWIVKDIQSDKKEVASSYFVGILCALFCLGCIGALAWYFTNNYKHNVQKNLPMLLDQSQNQDQQADYQDLERHQSVQNENQ